MHTKDTLRQTRTLRSRSLPTSCSWHHVSAKNVNLLGFFSIPYTGGWNAKLAPSKSSPHQKYTSRKDWRISLITPENLPMLVKRKGLSSNHLLFRSYTRLQGCIQTFPLEALTVEFRSETKLSSRREAWRTTSRKEKPYKLASRIYRINLWYVCITCVALICMGNVDQNTIHGSCGIASFIRLVCDSFRDSGSLHMHNFCWMFFLVVRPATSNTCDLRAKALFEP